MYKKIPTTAAYEYLVNTEDYCKDITITVNGTLAEGESIEVICPGSGGGADSDLYLDGTKIEITSTNSMARIAGSAILKISKAETLAAVGFRIA